MDLPIPQRLLESARAYATGERVPVEPRDAATVVLLRPGQQAPELYVLDRHNQMVFASGMTVFPGGGVDARDSEPIEWFGPPPEEWGRRLGAEPEQAAAVVVAAVREMFEEVGVLLAGSADEVMAPDGAAWESDRLALETGETSLAEVLNRRGLGIRTDLLRPWSGWLTPVFEPRRYRTWFFVAQLPEGQHARDVSTESRSVAWLTAQRGLHEALTGERGMLPPTMATCLDLSRFASIDAVMAQDREVEMFMPEVLEVDGKPVMTRPTWIAEVLGGLA